MNEHYTTTFSVDQTPAEVFAAINDVRGWWSQDIEGSTDTLGATFNYHFKDIHRCTMQITELVPNQKVVWHVADNYFSFIEDQTEWRGTDITFEITPKGHQAELRFTHIGLVPAYECYNICTDAWGNYIKGSLRNLIVTGQGQPNVGDAITADEKRLSR